MTGPNFSAIRVRLRYESLEDFMQGYTRFISKGGMFIPMSPAKLKPVGTTIRFQFLLQDGTTALLGEGVVRQIQGTDSGDDSPVGILVKFTRLNRQSKDLVEQIVARKGQTTDAAATPDAPPQEPVADTPAQDLDATPIPSAFTPDEHDEPVSASAVEPASNQADLDVASDALNQQDVQEKEEQFDDLFLSAEDDSASTPFDDSEATVDAEEPKDSSETSFPDFDFDGLSADEPSGSVPLGASGDDIFGDVPSQPDAVPVEVESEASEEAPPASANPQRLGSTEAGLQIMAFDRVSDDEAAGLADFDFGTDEGEVDQMFDDVFGDGGFFGGDGDDNSALDDAFDLGAPVAEPDIIGATANDGGEPFEFSDAFDSDAIQADEPALNDDDLINDDFEFSFDPPEKPLTEAIDDEDIFEVAEAVEDEQRLEDGDALEDDAFFDDGEILKVEDALFEDEDARFEDNNLLAESAGFADADLLEEEDVFEEPEFLIEDEPGVLEDRGILSEDFSPEYRPAPSDDLISVLGSLDSDEDHEPSRGLTLGSNAGIPAATPEDDEDEEEDSLASLLALAQQDIDAKREAEGEDVDNDPNADLFDQLLGGNDLPAPPKNQPIFDIADAAPKKKKGGFMSKLFGKD